MNGKRNLVYKYQANVYYTMTNKINSCGLALDEAVREELTVIPSTNDFEELSKNDLENKTGVLVLKNRLVMREGEHNEVYYSWDELKAGYLTGEGAGLFYDHDDSVKNYVGIVKNLKLNEGTKEIFGDIHVTDKQAAINLRLGAKWGISPTIDAEKLIKGGKKYALDPKFLSYALVLRPAVRETMLNSEETHIGTTERRLKSMENKEKLEEAEKQHKEEMEKKEGELKELRLANEKFKSDGISRESAKVMELGKKFGILADADMDKLKEMSDVGRSMLFDVIGRVAKTLKLEEDEKEDETSSKEEVADEKTDKAEETETDDLASNQKRMKEQLSENAVKHNSLNTSMLDFMRKQESRQ
jgi:hypothetical protein